MRHIKILFQNLGDFESFLYKIYCTCYVLKYRGFCKFDKTGPIGFTLVFGSQNDNAIDEPRLLEE